MKKFERLLNGERMPSHAEIERALGAKSLKLWNRLRDYLNAAYGIEPQLLFYEEKYGWCLRYRRSSKTLCSLFPVEGSFTALVTLGSKELEKLEPHFSDLTSEMQKLIKDTHLYHDGKWLWIRAGRASTIDDIKLLLAVKRRPKPT